MQSSNATIPSFYEVTTLDTGEPLNARAFLSNAVGQIEARLDIEPGDFPPAVPDDEVEEAILEQTANAQTNGSSQLPSTLTEQTFLIEYCASKHPLRAAIATDQLTDHADGPVRDVLPDLTTGVLREAVRCELGVQDDFPEVMLESQSPPDPLHVDPLMMTGALCATANAVEIRSDEDTDRDKLADDLVSIFAPQLGSFSLTGQMWMYEEIGATEARTYLSHYQSPIPSDQFLTDILREESALETYVWEVLGHTLRELLAQPEARQAVIDAGEW